MSNVSMKAAETAAAEVACTLTIGGRMLEFSLEGPLVAMAPADATTEKRPARARRSRSAAGGAAGGRVTARGAGYLVEYAEAQRKGAA